MLADPDLILDIIDIGVGIAESDRDKIFNLFYTQPVGDCGSRGTGLGLAISRAMIEAHGGRIWAFSGPNGNGTCMRISPAAGAQCSRGLNPLLYPAGG